MDPRILHAAARGYLVTASFLCAAGNLQTAGVFVAEAWWAIDKAATFGLGNCRRDELVATVEA